MRDFPRFTWLRRAWRNYRWQARVNRLDKRLADLHYPRGDYQDRTLR